MSTNPYIQNTINALNMLSETYQPSEAMALAAIQAQATLALAWEQARCADEARTANLLAALQSVPITGGKEWRADEETVLRIRAEIGARLYPEAPESAKGGVPE